MKKLMLSFMVFLLVFAGNSFDSKAIGISIKFEFGKHNAEGNCGPGRGICSVTIGGSLLTAPGSNGVQVLDAQAELKGDQLLVKFSKPIDEKGINERGMYSFVLDKPFTLDAATTKALGVSSVVLLPGKYTIQGNSFSYKVKVVSPRDSASGLPTGKR